ncbi:MAG: ribosome-inactivating family protein [Candidatus Sulfotelmatobacter sp.]
MTIAIATLPEVNLDYTNRGPGLHLGLKQLQKMLDDGREGYLAVNVAVKGAVIPVVLARADLYLVGFKCAGTWFRFDDADWPFSEAANKLGYDGQYRNLGGLRGDLTAGSIDGIADLANIASRLQWPDALRTLLVVVCECSRLIPVQMQVLGLLNGIDQILKLAPLAHYIRNWEKASTGMDMSREVTPNLRVGFKDPTIIKR